MFFFFFVGTFLVFFTNFVHKSLKLLIFLECIRHSHSEIFKVLFQSLNLLQKVLIENSQKLKKIFRLPV